MTEEKFNELLGHAAEKEIDPSQLVDAPAFVVSWLDAHQAEPTPHDEDWAHFVSIVADCAEAYAKSVLQAQIALQEQHNSLLMPLMPNSPNQTNQTNK